MKLRKINEFIWEIPASERTGMKVPGIIIADEEILEKALEDKATEQVINVAFLPSIVKASLAMPDIHWGYGFPIGGVAAFDAEDGIISPGGVGFDINCGVRVVKTNLTLEELKPWLEGLFYQLGANIPKGVGSRSKIRLSREQMSNVMRLGSKWAVKNGYGWEEDLECTEDSGSLEGANSPKLSQRVFERGVDQLGSLGAGNHFIEVQKVDEIYDSPLAESLGIFKDQITVMIHSGSRGTGHQICTDYLKVMDGVIRRMGVSLPDRQLVYAPLNSPEGKDYFSAMKAAANYAWANRQCLMHWVRECFEKSLRKSAEKLGMYLLYDNTHNIAKIEQHLVEGKKMNLCVHRKGATRSFPPGHPLVGEQFKESGQPVIIPGDMGTASYILVGTDQAMEISFGSTAHGAGRLMSRKQARKKIRGEELKKELEKRGIVVIAGHLPLLAEEAPQAYKDVDKVVEVCHQAQISKKVARLIPIGVIKG